MRQLSEKEINDFRSVVYDYYTENYRPMPWRDNTSEYYVFISEVMLQQTQVPRVIEKFKEFIERFPDWQALATATNADVLARWSGLGYNRRALFLKRSAEMVAQRFDGNLPQNAETLTQLPGIGPATAAAIITYAFNKPEVYIETNIRTVFIHHFLKEQENVDDAIVIELVRQTLDTTKPREWYWALMDYGTHLKKTLGNISRQSKQYVKQSTFKGSNRQARGMILKQLIGRKEIPETELFKSTPLARDRAENALYQLEKEGFITRDKDTIRLSS